MMDTSSKESSATLRTPPPPPPCTVYPELSVLTATAQTTAAVVAAAAAAATSAQSPVPKCSPGSRANVYSVAGSSAICSGGGGRDVVLGANSRRRRTVGAAAAGAPHLTKLPPPPISPFETNSAALQGYPQSSTSTSTDSGLPPDRAYEVTEDHHQHDHYSADHMPMPSWATGFRGGGGGGGTRANSMSSRPIYQRRLSVPDRALFTRDYAILRPSDNSDCSFEIVAAFDRHTDPYRHYMQSLTCYDLMPTHTSVVLIDGQLSVSKAVRALLASGHSAAVVTGTEDGSERALLTSTVCLRAVMASSEGISVADMPVSEFFLPHSQLIQLDSTASVWTAAKLLCANRVRRLAVVEETSDQNIVCLLSLRHICEQAVIRLSDPTLSLSARIKSSTIAEAKIGDWSGWITVAPTDTCRTAIKVLLENQLSCVPVVEADGHVVGSISKTELLDELTRARPHHHHTPNDGHAQTGGVDFSAQLARPVQEVCGSNLGAAVSHTAVSVFGAIEQLCCTAAHTLFLLDVEGRLQAIVTLHQLLEFILTPTRHHKHSVV